MKNKIYCVLKIVSILGLLIILLNLLANKSEKLFEVIGYRTYTVLSGSMEPKFYPGDIVVVKHRSKTDIQVNDIVTYKDDNEIIVTHRIIEEVDGGYITKGDNNNVRDAVVLRDEVIIGEAKFRIPKLGYMVNFLANPKVISIELIVLALMILFCCKDK